MPRTQHEILYRLHISVLQTDPTIWRLFQVPGRITLHRLHEIIQVVVGWENYHFYEFQIGTVIFTEPYEEYVEPERTVVQPWYNARWHLTEYLRQQYRAVLGQNGRRATSCA